MPLGRRIRRSFCCCLLTSFWDDSWAAAEPPSPGAHSPAWVTAQLAPLSCRNWSSSARGTAVEVPCWGTLCCLVLQSHSGVGTLGALLCFPDCLQSGLLVLHNNIASPESFSFGKTVVGGKKDNGSKQRLPWLSNHVVRGLKLHSHFGEGKGLNEGARWDQEAFDPAICVKQLPQLLSSSSQKLKNDVSFTEAFNVKNLRRKPQVLGGVTHCKSSGS